MQKLVVTLDSVFLAQAANPAQCSFVIDDGADVNEAAVRIAAHFYHQAENNQLSAMSVREITVSPGSGPGVVVPVIKDQVRKFVDFANQIGGINQVNLPGGGTDSFYGQAFGGIASLLPLGTSVLLSEIPLAGPKGRIYLPYASPSALNASGSMSPATAADIQFTASAYYGLLTYGSPLDNPMFRVASAAGVNQIQSLRCSVKYARLKSRTR